MNDSIALIKAAAIVLEEAKGWSPSHLNHHLYAALDNINSYIEEVENEGKSSTSSKYDCEICADTWFIKDIQNQKTLPCPNCSRDKEPTTTLQGQG